MDSSILTMMHGVGVLPVHEHRRAIAADPAVYARIPRVQRAESRAHGLARLVLIRFLQVAQTVTVHHGALAYPEYATGEGSASAMAQEGRCTMSQSGTPIPGATSSSTTMKPSPS
jgi:hypothetical protein